MSTGVIAQRYALALINLAAKKKEIDEVGQGLELVAQAISQSEKASKFIADPNVPKSYKDKVVEEIIGKSGVTSLVGMAVRFLNSKNRMSLLGEICRTYKTLADEQQGRAHADVIVAEAIDGQQQEAIRKQYERLSGKKLSLTVSVDPGILGGAITRIGSTVRDGSLRNQLKQIKSSIIHGKV